MSLSKDRENIVIVGGGIIGCTTAYYLTRHPRFDSSRHTITVVEAANIANAASSKAGGLLASWASPRNIAALSFDLHSELASAHRGPEIWGYRRVQCGQLTAICQPPMKDNLSALDRETCDQNISQSSSSIPLKTWWRQKQSNNSGLPKDLDWIKSEYTQSYEELADTSSTAQVHPLQFTTNIAKLAEQAGTQIVFGKVEHINCSGWDDASKDPIPLAACHNWSQARVVSVTYIDKTTAERLTIPATTVVLAAGPWTPMLLPKLRMSTVRAHSISVKLKRPASAYCLFTEITMKTSSIDHAALSSSKTTSQEIYSRPNNEIYICSQGDLDVPLPSPTEDVALSKKSCREIFDAAASVSDELRNGRVIARRACYMPTIDAALSRDPLIGRTGLDGLLLATGHSCWGISNAPATGKIISELIMDGEVSCVQLGNLDPRKVLEKCTNLVY